MLLDGVACHENAKRKLEVYATNHGKAVVKSFMLIVCKDTSHAAWVERFVKSDEFRKGAYRNKAIIVHSKQKGAESDANTRLLLDVENPENPVEIVIHVNMLKEGWDVNNLYTIVPLRTAASKILREQMVGRSLRLPYGERTGDRDVYAVMLTAHDKFGDILAEAQKVDSIFKAGNVIKVEDIEQEQVTYTQFTLEPEPGKALEATYSQTKMEKSKAADALFNKADELITKQVMQHIQSTPAHTVTPTQVEEITEAVKEQIAADSYGANGMQNIIMMFKRDIANNIYAQMMQHFYCENGFIQEEVVGTRNYNLQQSYGYVERVGLYDAFTQKIQSVLFEGIKKGVFDIAKFDSLPELLLARVLETDTDVQNWLRPAPKGFNITYNRGRNYEPDFVVETSEAIYLVEVKGEDKLNDPDVIAKKKRGVQYCAVASRWGKANGYKEWRYLFIPSKQVTPASSFMQLAKRFVDTEV